MSFFNVHVYAVPGNGRRYEIDGSIPDGCWRGRTRLFTHAPSKRQTKRIGRYAGETVTRLFDSRFFSCVAVQDRGLEVYAHGGEDAAFRTDWFRLEPMIVSALKAGLRTEDIRLHHELALVESSRDTPHHDQSTPVHDAVAAR
jgi:hypothetical protein